MVAGVYSETRPFITPVASFTVTVFAPLALAVAYQT